MIGRRLIVNADDFGFTEDVNEGIVDCHRNGILTATTLMTPGSAFDDAVGLAKANPSLDIGVHLVLVGAPGLPASVPALLMALARRKIDVYATLRAQVERVLDAGIVPTHLDTHKHTHLAAPVLRAVVRIAHEFGIRWIRRPADFPMRAQAPLVTRLVNGGVRFAARRYDRILNGRTTDHFTGFQLTGRLNTTKLIDLIHSLPAGVTELMCHPGYLREPLRAAATRLKESRVAEMRALTDPAARAALTEADVRLTTYRDL